MSLGEFDLTLNTGFVFLRLLYAAHFTVVRLHEILSESNPDFKKQAYQPWARGTKKAKIQSRQRSTHLTLSTNFQIF